MPQLVFEVGRGQRHSLVINITRRYLTFTIHNAKLRFVQHIYLAVAL